jgi:hypothetical protein
MTDPIGPEAIVQGVYEHYKGARYEVLLVARHSESEEWVVVYRQLYGDRSAWVRPLGMFAESVEVDGLTVPRFRRVGTDGEAGPAPSAAEGLAQST